MSVSFDKNLTEKYHFTVTFGSNSEGANIVWYELLKRV